MEIELGIHSIPVATGAFMGTYAPNVYLVLGQKPSLIDSGYGDDATTKHRLEYLEGLGNPGLDYIVVSHCHPDHIGGAEKFKLATGAEIVVHAQDSIAANIAFTKVTVDRMVEDSDILSLGGVELEMIHTPGHSPGHICVYVKESGALFSGDQVLGIGTTAISPPDGDMAQYIESLRSLQSLDINTIYPGHGPPIRQPKRKIEELIEHRLEREQQVFRYLSQGKATVRELVLEIYPELDSRLMAAARRQVLAHLIKLEREGKVTSQVGERDTNYAVL